MTTTQFAENPFVLMVNPQAVFAAIENSDRLARLTSRICRPLDRHAPALADGETADGETADGETADGETADAADAELDALSDSAADAA